jgi:chondroitin AC lyase
MHRAHEFPSPGLLATLSPSVSERDGVRRRSEVVFRSRSGCRESKAGVFSDSGNSASSRRRLRAVASFVAGLSLLLTGCATKDRSSSRDANLPAACRPVAVLATMERVADWQLANPGKHRTTDWTQGALYAGIMALDTVSPSPRFREAMRRVGEANSWQLGPSHYNADDHCLGQMYAELALRYRDPEMIAAMRAQFDAIIAKPSPLPSLDFSQRGAGDRWSWCDALFMAPPAWSRLFTATGDRRYLDYAVTNWWITSDYLYDPDEHLFYRDSTYFNRIEVNGKRVFWGRGNGWVMGGLVRVLQDVPINDPAREGLLGQFREMAAAVLQCQQADGLWRSSLLDSESYPLKETSASGFYTYALAWGVNEGLLDRTRFAPAIQRAWTALVGCVSPEGKLTHVQPIGADPKKFDVNHTDVYGVGAFLLAGSEVYRLNGGRVLLSRTNVIPLPAPKPLRVATAEDFRQISARYRQVILQRDPDWSSEKSVATDDQLREWASSQATDGTWPDIEYGNQERAFWKLSRHLDRTRLIARALVSPASAMRNDPKLEGATFRALDFWLAKRFTNPNWWWNQIGVPGVMCDIIVLLDDKLTGERRKGALQVLAQAGKPRSGSGANTIWIADLALQYGALTGDASLIEQCSRIVSGEIKITTEDGIQPDYSFHQHYARLQQFSYGRPYLTTSTRIAWQLRGTPWNIATNKIELLADFALRGDQWMCRGITTVPATLDRSVSRPGTLKWADLRESLAQLRELLPSRALELEEFLARQNNQGEPLVGARAFPRSDFTVFHRPAFSFFLKTLSDRTLPTEVGLNSEHLKGQFQNCGDYYLLRDGREYFDLAPVWDWNLLPGLTFTEGMGKPLRQSFVGSVTDGFSSATVMDYRFGTTNEVRLSAKKFWVCHGDAVVALVADLKSSGDEPVWTSLEQCHKRGPVIISTAGKAAAVESESESATNLNWVHHSGFAYFPLGESELTVTTEVRRGMWQAINAALSSEPVKSPVLLLTMKHEESAAARNCGYVIAACEAAQVENLFRNPPWRVLRNDAHAQAVCFGDGTLAVAFHESGAITLPAGLTVAADRPCMLLRRQERVWLYDPTQKGMKVTVRLGTQKHSILLPPDGSVCEWSGR